MATPEEQLRVLLLFCRVQNGQGKTERPHGMTCLDVLPQGQCTRNANPWVSHQQALR